MTSSTTLALRTIYNIASKLEYIEYISIEEDFCIDETANVYVTGRGQGLTSFLERCTYSSELSTAFNFIATERPKEILVYVKSIRDDLAMQDIPPETVVYTSLLKAYLGKDGLSTFCRCLMHNKNMVMAVLSCLLYDGACRRTDTGSLRFKEVLDCVNGAIEIPVGVHIVPKGILYTLLPGYMHDEYLLASYCTLAILKTVFDRGYSAVLECLLYTCLAEPYCLCYTWKALSKRY